MLSRHMLGNFYFYSQKKENTNTMTKDRFEWFYIAEGCTKARLRPVP